METQVGGLALAVNRGWVGDRVRRWHDGQPALYSRASDLRLSGRNSGARRRHTLNGSTVGEKMEVTLVKVVDPAQSANQFLQPTPGMREIALELRYKNVGSTTYSPSVLGDVTVIDQASHSYSSDFENTTAGTFPGLPGFPFGLVNIAPGESADDGFATFQIPQGTPVTQVKLTVDLVGGALGADTGEWLVP